MNLDFIYRAVIKDKLDKSFNNLDFVYHIFNDKTPENIKILEEIRKVQDSISILKHDIESKLQDNNDKVKQGIEKELADRMADKPGITKGLRPR